MHAHQRMNPSLSSTIGKRWLELTAPTIVKKAFFAYRHWFKAFSKKFLVGLIWQIPNTQDGIEDFSLSVTCQKTFCILNIGFECDLQRSLQFI